MSRGQTRSELNALRLVEDALKNNYLKGCPKYAKANKTRVRKFRSPLKFEIFNKRLSHDELKNEDVGIIAPECD